MQAIRSPAISPTPSIREMANARREGRVWHGPDSTGMGARRFSWKRILMRLFLPPRDQRVTPSFSGVVLIALALVIGFAAYNTANNILFIALSLLLSCLLLSGALSWLNMAKVSWRLRIEPALRVGVETLVVLEVRNRKRVLPSYGLSFHLQAGEHVPVRKILPLRERLEPRGARSRMEWIWKPEQRGAVRVEITSVVSLFPFGFLRKRFCGGLKRAVIVWPRPAKYRSFPALSRTRSPQGRALSRQGHGGDLYGLRAYVRGDSYRLIHWKASARAGQLLVRQFSAESAEGFSIWVDPSADRWFRPEQFELLMSLAGSLAEDLFREGRLDSVLVADGPSRRVRRLGDVEAFLDELAVLQPVPVRIPDDAGSITPTTAACRGKLLRNLLTFAPDGVSGVAAYLDGQKAAAT